MTAHTDHAHDKDQTTVTITHTEDGITVIDEIITYPLKPLAVTPDIKKWLDGLSQAVTVHQLPYSNTDLLKRLRERSHKYEERP